MVPVNMLNANKEVVAGLPTALDAIAALMGRCWGAGEVRSAFEQLRDVAQDLVLDLPTCREQTSDLVWAAVGRGLLQRADLIQDGATIV